MVKMKININEKGDSFKTVLFDDISKERLKFCYDLTIETLNADKSSVSEFISELRNKNLSDKELFACLIIFSFISYSHSINPTGVVLSGVLRK